MASRKTKSGLALKTGEFERKDGQLVYKYKGFDGKYHFAYARTLPELRKKEEQIKKDLSDGIDFTEANTTLNKLYKVSMAAKKNLRATTRVNYNNLWAFNVEDSFLGKMKVKDIKNLHIKRFCNEMSSKGLKKNTVKSVFLLINATLNFAVENDIIRRNPAKGALDDIKPDALEKIPLSEDELKRILEFCMNSPTYNVYAPFITVAVGTCLRCGEITGLTWNDIDLKNNVIKVDHQLIYKNYGDGCKFHIATPKTAAGVREIPITETVHRAFLQIKKQNMMLGKRCLTVVDGYTDFVFVNKNGKPFADNGVNNFLLNIENAYKKQNPGLSMPHISTHILRHTGCTRNSILGMDIKVQQKIMGHSDCSVTMNVYNHCDTQRVKDEIKRLENVINF
jgi:integrase